MQWLLGFIAYYGSQQGHALLLMETARTVHIGDVHLHWAECLGTLPHRSAHL